MWKKAWQDCVEVCVYSLNAVFRVYTLNILCFTRYSAATDLRWGENFNKFLFRNLLLYIAVKKLRKSVNICLSYRKNKSVSFFMAHSAYAQLQRVQNIRQSVSYIAWSDITQRKNAVLATWLNLSIPMYALLLTLRCRSFVIWWAICRSCLTAPVVVVDNAARGVA